MIVDVREVAGVAGYLRTVTIHRGNRVTIEFQLVTEYLSGDMEGGGLKYISAYDELPEAVRDLEDFLNAPISAWRNFTRQPLEVLPAEAESAPPENEYFENLVRANGVQLPRAGHYRIAGIYWRHIARYGQYREDKLLEEQEEDLAGLEAGRG